MKILVCISNVPDTTAKINFSADNKQFITDGVTFIINPYDEIALARAIELAEANGGTVTAINVGDATTEATIRKALAIGAHDAVRVNAAPRDAYFVASQIAHYASTNGYTLVLCGRESADHNGSSVPVMIAELLDVPSILFAKKLDITGNEATLEREIEGGKEVVTCTLPLVAGASEGMAEPKIPNMRGIMASRTKPLTVVEPIAVDTLSTLEQYEKPLTRSAVKMINPEDVNQLFDLIRTEKKII
ncbi:MAG: Electron transfer flavoprotein small subunit [Bacteroidota bacterium]|jgi:electron transfer flavoprotein beta subunit